jgi:hypothetical protein
LRQIQQLYSRIVLRHVVRFELRFMLHDLNRAVLIQILFYIGKGHGGYGIGIKRDAGGKIILGVNDSSHIKVSAYFLIELICILECLEILRKRKIGTFE